MLKNVYFTAYCLREALELGFSPEDLPSSRELSLRIDQNGSNDEYSTNSYNMKNAKIVSPELSDNTILNDIFTITTKNGDLKVKIPDNYRFGPISIVPTKT